MKTETRLGVPRMDHNECWYFQRALELKQESENWDNSGTALTWDLRLEQLEQQTGNYCFHIGTYCYRTGNYCFRIGTYCYRSGNYCFVPETITSYRKLLLPHWKVLLPHRKPLLPHGNYCLTIALLYVYTITNELYNYMKSREEHTNDEHGDAGDISVDTVRGCDSW